jgi:hypothetical protein
MTMMRGVGLSRETILAVREAVARDFPEMRDVDPLVEKMNVRVEGTEIIRYRVSFRRTVLLEEGVPSTQRVRATTDDEGNILKILSSRG